MIWMDMEIYINGEKKQVEEGLNVLGLLEKLEIESQSVVIEKNEVVLPRQNLEGVLLMKDDKIEIVRFVGGGA
jgi:sulfur carrier protein